VIPVTVSTLPTWRYRVISQVVTNTDGTDADLAHARPGQQLNVTISVKNTGTATWTSNGSNRVLLGTYRPKDHDSALTTPEWVSATRPARLSQPSVAPGGTGTFTFPILTPNSAGTVTEHFNLVAEEDTTWFNDQGLFIRLNVIPVVGMMPTPDGGGYWLIAADGGVFAFGNAKFHGSAANERLQKPVVGMAATPDGRGYWLVAADGGVFTYGNAKFYGSAADVRLQKPVVGMAATPDGGGYWLVAADGGVFSYGNAKFHGSAANDRLRRPVVGIAAHPQGNGYWLATSDGTVRHFIAEDSQTRDIPPPPTDWQLNGAARINGGDLVLTPAENDTAGTAFYKQAVKAGGLHASFTAVMEGGSGADGLTLAFLDPASAATTDVGGTGGLLGFAGVAGAAVALDTWPNLNDPSDNFVGVAQGTKTTGYNEEGPLWLATTTEVPRLIGSHQVEVTYGGGRLKVRIDANQVLDTAVELPTNVLVGFTAATGNATNVHTIRDVTITPGEGGSPPRVS
jgi:hypothetical protein